MLLSWNEEHPFQPARWILAQLEATGAAMRTLLEQPCPGARRTGRGGGEHLRRAWERGARELAELAELAFLQSKPCASTSCWFARGWASAGHLLRAAAASGTAGAARGGGAGPCAAAGAGVREGRVGSEERQCLRVAASDFT